MIDYGKGPGNECQMHGRRLGETAGGGAYGPLIDLRVSTDNAGPEEDPQMCEALQNMRGHGYAVKVVGLDCTHLLVGHDDHANEVLNIGILNMQT